MTVTPASEKIERASAQMVLRLPWFASLYLNLVRVETTAIDVPTMATDGTFLFYNPEFTMSLTDKECLGVLAHETLHCGLMHVYRRKHRDPVRWNIACDKAVNAVLVAANIPLPKGGVPPGPLGSLAEELYEQITPEEMALYGDHDVLDAGSRGNTPGAKTEKDWRDILAGAYSLMPAGIARTIQEAAAPRKDWKEELARFVHSTVKSDTRTWTRQSRRVQGLPGWSREIESNIIVVLDTSGSVTPSILNVFAAECRAILSLNGISAVVMSADAAVHQIIQPGEPFPSEFKGGGGTSFIPALKAAENYQPNCIIYLTDGDGAYPKSSQFPVLWALTKPHKVPFGETILLEGISDGDEEDTEN